MLDTPKTLPLSELFERLKKQREISPEDMKGFIERLKAEEIKDLALESNVINFLYSKVNDPVLKEIVFAFLKDRGLMTADSVSRIAATVNETSARVRNTIGKQQGDREVAA